MQPQNTIYRLASPGGEFNKLYAMGKRVLGHEIGRLRWPTIVAERDGVVVGFLGTLKHDEVVLAGPLVIDLPSRMFVAMRLMEAYERLRRITGVMPILFVVKRDNARWLEHIQILGGIRLFETPDDVVFRRD